jgi:flagellum-specific ATP synthase
MNFGSTEAAQKMRQYLADCVTHTGAIRGIQSQGRLARAAGLVMEAVGLQLPVGSGCRIVDRNGSSAEAEVVGFSGDRIFLMPTGDVNGLRPGAAVVPIPPVHTPPAYGRRSHPWRRMEDRAKHLPVGEGLLGRVLDGTGAPLDGIAGLDYEMTMPLFSRPINPIHRQPISRPLDVGVRAINSLLRVGRGQRMGLFAGSGVGKSVLLGMMARYTEAEVTIVGLIGERGREVKEFIEQILGAEGRARSIVIAAPADTSPLLRMQAAAYATTLAEYFRDRGKHVLLIMDSLTRYAMAQREIALAVGEPPATKGYPPSVFARLPQLVERAGNGTADGGSITAFYTVLTEGDDQQDPVADSARAILDGHIVLSRELAEQGHYPAIDIEQSISRVAHLLCSPEELARARRLKHLYSRFQKTRDLITVGAYAPGSDPAVDEAIERMPAILKVLQQHPYELADLAASNAAMSELFAPPGARTKEISK